MSDRSEKRVGALLIRGTPLEDGEPPYRSQMGSLRIERAGGGVTGYQGPGMVTGLIAVLMAGLLSFAVIVRSWPAVGTVTFAIIALGWLVLRRRPAAEVRWVEVGAGKLTAGGEGEPLEVALDDVDDVGVGVDGAFRSVFVRVEGEGRRPLLYGLDPEEAEAASESVREALARLASP